MNTAVFVFVFSCFVLKSEKKSIEWHPKELDRGRESDLAGRIPRWGKVSRPRKSIDVIGKGRLSRHRQSPSQQRHVSPPCLPSPTYPREERVHDRPTFRQHKVQMSSRIQSTFCVFGVFCVVVRAVGVGREQPLQ